MASKTSSANRLKIEHLVLVLGLGGLIALSAIGMVWRKAVVQNLGRELKASKQKVGELGKQLDALRREYDGLAAPAALEAQVQSLRLGLALPTAEQVVKLTDPAIRTAPREALIEAPRASAPRLMLGEVKP